MVVTIDLMVLSREVVRKNSICYLWWQNTSVVYNDICILKLNKSRDRELGIHILCFERLPWHTGPGSGQPKLVSSKCTY